MSSLQSGFMQTHGSCIRLCQGEQQPFYEADYLFQHVAGGSHLSAGFHLFGMYGTCKRLQSRSASLQLCNQDGFVQLDLKASPAIGMLVRFSSS